MKIILVSQNASPGLLIFRKDLICLLVSQGHDVYAFAIDYTVESSAAIRMLGAIPIEYSLSKTGVNPFSDIKNIYKLFLKIKKISPDVVFSFFIKPSIYATLAARLACVDRRISLLEGLGYIHTDPITVFSFKKIVLRFIHGFLCTIGYAFADRVLFLNESDPKDLSRFSYIRKSKINVIGPIGLDLANYPHVEIDLSKPIRFVFVARLLAEKGVFEFLAACRMVKHKYPNVEFLVLGGLDFDNPTALNDYDLRSVISEGLIIYPGYVSNVSNWISDSHVFVLPSYREGMPRSTQEAMAIGRAVITTDVPGCRDTVIDGLNGFLVPPRNAQAIADKMIYFIENPSEIKRMGYESHQIALNRFDVHKINKTFVKIISGID